jgi:GTP-binding protein
MLIKGIIPALRYNTHMIIDEITLKIKAGDGGDGAVSFRREKYVPKGGPDGGNGGKGADIYFKGVSDLSALHQFRFKKELKAENGQKGGRKKMTGKDAPNLIVSIPIGTVVTNLETKKAFSMDTVGELFLIAKGGRGGLGTFELRSPSNTTPRVAEDGEKGEEYMLSLNLRYIADIGLIGLPNSGKSSLLNAITNTDVKTADYAFTTLEPNLGSRDGHIIADIPGLIEGASVGKGLGIKFLKHIEKTHILIHCIDVSQPDLLQAYETIRKELSDYNPQLLDKKEYIILTKTDLVSPEELQKKIKTIKKIKKPVLTVSIIDDKSLNALVSVLLKNPASDDGVE